MVKHWPEAYAELEKTFEQEAVLRQLVGERWLSPLHWKSKPLAQVLFEASQFKFEVELPREVLQKLEKHSMQSKPQAVLYRELVPIFNPQNFEALIQKRGLGHFVDEDTSHGQKVMCDKIAGSLSCITAAVAKTRHSKFGALQVIRFLCNAVCTPHRFQKKEEKCAFCLMAGSRFPGKFKLSHLMSCRHFERAICKAMHDLSVQYFLEMVRGNTNFLLGRALLALADADAKARETCLEIFSVASLAINAVTHHAVKDTNELSKIVRAFRKSDEAAFERVQSHGSAKKRRGTRPTSRNQGQAESRTNSQVLYDPTVEDWWH